MMTIVENDNIDPALPHNHHHHHHHHHHQHHDSGALLPPPPPPPEAQAQTQAQAQAQAPAHALVLAPVVSQQERLPPPERPRLAAHTTSCSPPARRRSTTTPPISLDPSLSVIEERRQLHSIVPRTTTDDYQRESDSAQKKEGEGEGEGEEEGEEEEEEEAEEDQRRRRGRARSKRKRYHRDEPGTDEDQRSLRTTLKNNSNQSASIDALQLAHLITSIQAHQHHPASSPAPQSEPHPRSIINYPAALPSSSSHHPNLNDHDGLHRIHHALNPLQIEISRLRARIETLEDERLIMAREITCLKAAIHKSSDPLHLGLSSSTHPAPLSIGDDPRILPSSKPNNPLIMPLSRSTPSFDIPVGPPLDALSPPQPGSSSSSHLDLASQSLSNLLTTPQSKSTLPSDSLQITTLSSSKPDPNLPFRRTSSRKKSDLSASTPTSSIQANNNRAKHRKPELSRAVRATVFKLMGVSSTQSPVPTTSDPHGALANEPSKFGNEKSRAYHGYTTTPCFPEYTTEELFDPMTKLKIWRWDWSKTIRQSLNNTNFAKEIRKVIVKEAADPVRPMHTEVPTGDWLYLDDAIDSAYTNMRRERDNLIDPNKMVKKEVHRARNKKRGLKEDKFKRRRKALDEYRADPISFSKRFQDLDLKLLDKPKPTKTKRNKRARTDSQVDRAERVGEEAAPRGDGMDEQEEEQKRPRQREDDDEGEEEAVEGTGEEDRWDDALDIKYMSSEDEANVHDFENPVSVGTDKSDNNTLASSDKVFAICRPTWRSGQLQELFTILDTIKQPERAYRRVMGPPRHSRPPVGTPSWMIKEDDGESPSMKNSDS